MKKPPIAHLLLAAGASTRMGRPKQLLKWRGKSLIRHAVEQIREAGISEKIIVVLGAKHEKIQSELVGLPVAVTANNRWQMGMGSSIQAGLKYLLEENSGNWEGVCISLVDQPLVTALHFQNLYKHWCKTPMPIAAAAYEGTIGVPAIFDRSFFNRLLELEGPVGARKMLQQFQEQVLPFPLPEAASDVDTPADFQRLKDDD